MPLQATVISETLVSTPYQGTCSSSIILRLSIYGIQNDWKYCTWNDFELHCHPPDVSLDHFNQPIRSMASLLFISFPQHQRPGNAESAPCPTLASSVWEDFPAPFLPPFLPAFTMRRLPAVGDLCGEVAAAPCTSPLLPIISAVVMDIGGCFYAQELRESLAGRVVREKLRWGL